MGIDQILRVARLSAIAAVLGTAMGTAGQAGARPLEPRVAASPAASRVVIIDLRSRSSEQTEPAEPVEPAEPAGSAGAAGADAGDARARSRAALAAELATIEGIALEPGDAGSELGRALAGEPADGNRATREAARAAMERAAAAYGNLDCPAAEQAAGQAIDALSALQASAGAAPEAAPGATLEAITGELVQAHVYMLLCAHARGDSDAALLAARRLGRLGVHSAPRGVSDLIWNLYPAVDATANLPIVELTIATEPAGADVAFDVWFDNARVGKAPVTVYTTEGEHIIAAGPARPPGGRPPGSQPPGGHVDGQYGGVSRRVMVTAHSKAETLSLPAIGSGSRWRAVAERVAAWQGSAGPSPGELGALLDGLGVRFGLVLSEERRVAIWALAPGDSEARRIGTATMDQVVVIAARVQEHARAWDGGADSVLVRETRVTRAAGKASEGQKWWVYATIIGAVVLGSGIILASDLADDRQRIELVWP